MRNPYEPHPYTRIEKEYTGPETEWLSACRARARALCEEFNQPGLSADRRQQLQQTLFPRGNPNAILEAPIHVSCGRNTMFEEDIYCAGGLTIEDDHMDVRICRNTYIGPNVMLLTNIPSRVRQEMSGPVSEDSRTVLYIGENVWIGGGAILCGPLSIEDNVRIAPGSVVSGDVPRGEIVSGNPAMPTSWARRYDRPAPYDFTEPPVPRPVAPVEADEDV